MDDNDHLDDAFTDLIAARRVTIADEDATYNRVVEHAHRRIARRRFAGATLALVIVGTGAATIAIATRPTGTVAVQAAASASPTTRATTTTLPSPPVTTVSKASLGIEIEKGGTIVVGTITGSRAAGTGIAPGDRIVSINGHDTADASAIALALKSTHSGQMLHITWQDKQGHDHSAAVPLP